HPRFGDVPRHPEDEEVAQTLVEDQFGGHARIGAGQDDLSSRGAGWSARKRAFPSLSRFQAASGVNWASSAPPTGAPTETARRTHSTQGDRKGTMTSSPLGACTAGGVLQFYAAERIHAVGAW